MSKYYIGIRDNKCVNIGRHWSKPKDAICELPVTLVGKCFKVTIVDGQYKVVLDEIAEAERLSE